MAMQDTCRETVDELIKRFHDHIEYSYDRDHWSRYVSAVISLAEIEFELMHAGPFYFDDGTQAPPPKKSPRLRAIDFVLQNLLSPPDSTAPRPEVIALLAQLAKSTERLRTAIIDLHNWRTSEWGIEERLRSEQELVSIKELYEAVISVLQRSWDA